MMRFGSIAVLLLAACQTVPTDGEPSLGRRAAEAIDPRLPVEATVDTRPADEALAARIRVLMAEARASANAFAAAEPGTRAAAAAAGAPQSESWIAAQLALSELERTRAGFTRALADLDALHANLARSDRASAADLAALESAANDLRGTGERQVETLDSIRAMIAG